MLPLFFFGKIIKKKKGDKKTVLELGCQNWPFWRLDFVWDSWLPLVSSLFSTVDKIKNLGCSTKSATTLCTFFHHLSQQAAAVAHKGGTLDVHTSDGQSSLRGI
jgi:hypothetical protein